MSDVKPVPGTPGFTVTDVAQAPFIYFEEAPAYSTINGLIRITLSAERTLCEASKIATDQVVTAYLRTNVQGARALIQALESAVLLSQPVENPEGPAN